MSIATFLCDTSADATMVYQRLRHPETECQNRTLRIPDSKTELTKGPATSCAVEERRLAKIEVQGRNRCGLLAEVIQFVESLGGSVIHPYGAVQSNGDGRVELLYEAGWSSYSTMKSAARGKWPDYKTEVFEIPCSRPVALLFSVDDQSGVFRDVCAVLHQLRCDILQTAIGIGGSVEPNSPNGPSTFGIVIRIPTVLEIESLQDLLERTLRDGDRVVVDEDCGRVNGWRGL